MDRQGVIVDRGHFVRRASEIVGVYTQPRSKHARVLNPEVLMFFTSESESGSFSHTVQSHSELEKSRLDARKDVVIAMARIFAVFISVMSIQPGLPVRPAQLVPFIQSLTTPQAADTSHVVAFVTDAFANIQLSEQAKEVFGGLSQVGIRTHDRIMSLVLKMLGAKQADPQRLEDIYRALATRRAILANDFRERDMLFLRQLKSIYINQYGFNDAIAKCASLEQIRTLVPADTYTALARVIEIKK